MAPPFTPSTPRTVQLDHVGGLEIETNPRRRPQETWQRLDNFDLFVSGAIRKVRGIHVFHDLAAYPQPIVAIRNYRRMPTDPLRVIGMDAHGVLYDLETGLVLVDTAPAVPPPGGPVYRRPWLGQMTGLADGVSDPTTPSTPDPVNYIVTSGAVEGQQPVKTDAVTVSEMGISAPTEAPFVLLLLVVNTAVRNQDGTAGMIGSDPPLVGWQYVYTYWEPTTRHESSPSPLGAGVGPSELIQITGDMAAAVPVAQQIGQVRIHIPATPPAIGNTPTLRKRVYRTRDGGQTLFLLTDIFDADADGSIPLAQTDALDGLQAPQPIVSPVGSYFVLWFDPTTKSRTIDFVQIDVPGPGQETVTEFYPGVGLPVAQPLWTLLTTIGATAQTLGTDDRALQTAPASDSTLVEPAPNPGDNDPPEPAAWGAVYQGRVFLLAQAAQNRLDYSEASDSAGGPGFESFPPTNFFNLNASQDDPVTALSGQYQQLVIGKLSSTDRLIGTDFTDFVVTPLDPQIGIVGRACLANSEGQLFVLAQQYLIAWQGDVPSPYGRAVRPYTDAIAPTAKFERIVAAIDSIQGIGLMSLVTADVTKDSGFRYDLLLFDLSQGMPFSRVVDIPFEVTALAEVRVPNTAERVMLMALADGRVYQLWTGDFLATETPLVATAQTQAIPQDDPDNRKAFRELWVQLDNYNDWAFQWSCDGLPPTPFIPLQANNPLGGVGKQITITFRHDGEQLGERVTLPFYAVTFVTIGEAR